MKNHLRTKFTIFLLYGVFAGVYASGRRVVLPTDTDEVSWLEKKNSALLHDTPLFNIISDFAREKLPERIVHARGAGAYGVFKVTHDITSYTKANLFNSVGKETPVFVRFSTTGMERGSADTIHDARGFAIRFYTEEGNYDLVGNNVPVFAIEDPRLFPSFYHSRKRTPDAHLRDPNEFWEFASVRPEVMHHILMLFSESGYPDGYRHMNGFGIHAFKMVNTKGREVYVKYSLLTDQGIQNLTPENATKLCGTDPDYAIRDLKEAIERGDFPSWTMYIQVMTLEEAKASKFNPFDPTKLWMNSPLIPVGKLTLNKKPTNYFYEVEHVAFRPSNLVPGIELSPDRLLQARAFAYADAQHYRLGALSSGLSRMPVNRPLNSKPLCEASISYDDGPTEYLFPKNSKILKSQAQDKEWSVFYEDSLRNQFAESTDPDEDFEQARIYYKSLDAKARTSMIQNLVHSMKNTRENVRDMAVRNCIDKIDWELGQKFRLALSREF